MNLATKMSFWNKNQEISDKDVLDLQLSDAVPSLEDLEDLQAAPVDKRFPHSGKPSLVDKIADTSQSLKNWAARKFFSPSVPASEQVIDQAPEKPTLRERIANLQGKAVQAVTATGTKLGETAVDWTKRAAYQTKAGLDTAIDASRYPRMKTYDGLHKAFIEKPVSVAAGTASATRSLWSSLKSGTSSLFSKPAEMIANHRADAAYRAYVRENSQDEITKKPNLFSRIKTASQSLKDPEIRARTWETVKKLTPEVLAQMAASLPAGMAAKALVTASAGASFGTALAGGALASVVTGNIIKEYRKSKNNDEKPQLEGFFNKAAYLGKDMVKGSWFGIKHVAQGEIVWSLANEWKEDKGAILKRAGFGAVMGGIGWNILGHEAATHIDATQNDPTIVTDAHKIPLAPAETPAAPVEVKILSAEQAQALKDQAVHEYWHGDKAKGLDMFRTAAENGNTQALRDYFELTGEHVQFKHVPSWADKLPTTPQAVAPEVAASDVKPSLNLDLNDIQNQAISESAGTSATETSSAFEKAFESIEAPSTGQIITGAAAVTGTGAAYSAANALLPHVAAAALGAPKEAPRAPAVAQMCKVIDKPETPHLYDVNCRQPRFDIMNPGDAIGFEYNAPGQPTRIEYSVLDSKVPYRTLDIEQAVLNDTAGFSGIVRKLRGQVAQVFNKAVEFIPAQAQNDNSPAENISAQQIAMGRDFN